MAGQGIALLVVPTQARQGPAGQRSAAGRSHRDAKLLALRAGNPLSQNQLMERYWLTRAAAAKVRKEAAGASNGHPHAN